MQVSSARAPNAPSSSAASVAVNTSPVKACRDIANPLPGFARPYQHPRAAVEAQRLRRATRLSILRRLVDLAARRVQMPLFIVRHRHEPERCPATDPYMGAMLLNYLSRPNVRHHGVNIQGEAVVQGEHTLYMIIESSDEDRVRAFMSPFAEAGTVDVYPASTCVRV